MPRKLFFFIANRENDYDEQIKGTRDFDVTVLYGT